MNAMQRQAPVVTDEAIEYAAAAMWSAFNAGKLSDQPKRVQDQFFAMANEAITAYLDTLNLAKLH